MLLDDEVGLLVMLRKQCLMIFTKSLKTLIFISVSIVCCNVISSIGKLCNLLRIKVVPVIRSCIPVKNLFMLSVRISSYVCTWEVWKARKMRKSCMR